MTLENDGNCGGRYTVESILDGEQYEEYNAFVGPSQTKHVTFTYVFEKPGTYTITVGDQSVGTAERPSSRDANFRFGCTIDTE
ncbi:hypothetical protein C495_16935 [Natronorubrum sulfidifaciens JCM 14089]|uniref:CARDB domain-containing protein n=1 Tax=Natronorubrum sulfidifaciens JCM 14089 TaxID=1230460 RepID=L9VVC4_9EURY|nr:hypothetical protein C495_16935 [Natronorubrum sulfidifaciens JCM 14089]